MGRSSPPSRCARAAARSCCRCCCFRFPFRPSCRWWRVRLRFSPEKTPPTSTSCCFSPTMWCLLQLVSRSSKRFCTRNEAALPHPRDSDGNFSRLCPTLGARRGHAYRCTAGRRLPHHLLSRAFGLDRVSTLLYQFHCVDSVSGQRERVDRKGREVDCDRSRRDRRHRDLSAASAAAVSVQRHAPQRDGDDDHVHPCLLLSCGMAVSRRAG